MTYFDQALVEKYHPNYNCDKIAYLNDLWCMVDKEWLNNISEWHTIQNYVSLSDEDITACNAIYDWLSYGGEVMCYAFEVNADFVTKFGDHILNTYGKELNKVIAELEEEIMKETINNM